MPAGLCSSRRGLGTGPGSSPSGRRRRHRRRSRHGTGEGSVRHDWPAPRARPAIRSRGLTLSLCEWGDASSARLVLVGAHGFLDCAEFFAPLAGALRRQDPGLALVALSFAGHGRSDWADAYGWYDHAADLAAVARAVAARAADGATLGLVGHSFGGVQVLQALALEPRLARFAVNLDAVAERRAASNPRLPLSLLRWLAPHLARQQDGRYVWRVDPALVGWTRPWDLSGAPPADPLALTAALPHPVLTVTGAAQDHPQVRGRYPGDAAIAALPGNWHCRLQEAGHYVHLERPGQVAAAILRHAARPACGPPA